MLGSALRRLVLAVPLLIGITLISFFVIHLAPGEPTDLGTGDTPVQSDREVRERLRQMYGLDKPLHVQYVNWLTRLVRLDFGRSFSPDARPVLQKIGERLPITLLLNVVEMTIIIALAIPIGVFSATRQYSRFDKVTTIFVFVGFATPDFWLALMLMILFGVQLGWLPIVTVLGLSLPGLIGGSVIVESIFAIPGMGQLMVQAVFERDYPVIMGNLVIVATLTLGANLIADLTYSLVDPRIRVAARRGRR